MGCLITISPLIEQIIQNGDPFIKVTGTATECGKLLVSIKCSLTFRIPEIFVPVLNDGGWVAIFPNTGCGCQRPIEVTAICPSNTECIPASFTGPLHCPPGCPIIEVNAQPDDCNGGKRNVRFSVRIVDFAGNARIITQIDFGDGTSSENFICTSLNDNYHKDHLYQMQINSNAFVVFVAPDNCQKIPIPIPLLQPCLICPTTDDIGVSAGDCNSNTNKTPFTITIHTNGFGQIPTAINFGDGTTKGPFNINAEEGVHQEQHEYSPSDHSYIITVQMGACPPVQVLTGTVVSCLEEPQLPDESIMCFLGRILIVLSTSLVLVLLGLAACFPVLAHTLLILAGVAATIALIVFAIWYFVSECQRPCCWGYLYGWQVSVTTAIGLLYYSFCCQNLLWAGIPLFVAAIGLFGAWIRCCHPSKCVIALELASVLTVFILPVIGWIGNIGVLQQCENPIVRAILFTLNAIVVIWALTCNKKADDTQTA